MFVAPSFVGLLARSRSRLGRVHPLGFNPLPRRLTPNGKDQDRGTVYDYDRGIIYG